VHPLDADVSGIALSWLRTTAACVKISAATLLPLAGVMELPVIAESGCVIFWMCSLMICRPVPGDVV
jgi:hypothetical protein